ncbi:23S rRNA (uracil(1939)-C(5))-methyltransferase RlmD [Peribacillus sp. SCS-26]|uniref:23S rRNA (uracil(1939)-C(5))-methyltransferase RlmD n=1 Tax=Paraperibacillus marinus TaxID=3115295 RepID=UPI0039069AB7
MNNTLKQEAKLEPGQTFPLTIKRLGINGEGVGYFKRQVVFVHGAIPGEEVLAEAVNVQPKYAEARIKKIRKESEHRTTPPCPVYYECGGCQLQHIAYERQLLEKRNVIIQALEKYKKSDAGSMDIRQTIGMEEPWHYRNKSQFQVGTDQNGQIIAGLYAVGTHKLIDVPECIVQHPKSNRATRVVKKLIAKLQIPVYNERKKKGVVRTIVTRVGFETGELQVVIVTATEKLPQKEQLIAEIKKQLPEVVSVVQNVNPKNTSTIFGEKSIHLSGENVIRETLGDMTYELSARTFFQLNPVQTIKLYDEVKKAAALTGKEKVVDAYCGVGTIGLWLADGAKEIRGMDVIKESIMDAKKNAARQGVKNTRYEVGKAEDIMPKWSKEGFRADVLIVDPPRTGLDNKLLQTIIKVKPKKIVYVSCNPSTLAKNLEFLSSLYKVNYIQPVDMFPQTSHVESCTLLVLR